MRTIPQIRMRLHELADQLGVQELHDLAEETKRRSPVRRARVSRPKLLQSENTLALFQTLLTWKYLRRWIAILDG